MRNFAAKVRRPERCGGAARQEAGDSVTRMPYERPRSRERENLSPAYRCRFLREGDASHARATGIARMRTGSTTRSPAGAVPRLGQLESLGPRA